MSSKRDDFSLHAEDSDNSFYGFSEDESAHSNRNNVNGNQEVDKISSSKSKRERKIHYEGESAEEQC
ncbi:hypothetical protein DPMN_181741 [Dreissena polymorpha]|uniref:Uncharacterized protein n=1 Tax=Dreissena polymorpha TaxID=45954 RepID=A0A9D4DEA1_DREPO|nr:hypothetical protein DPMN_181741 [Dreissena polymorpha]